jgi:Zn-dependent M32 family carboxypeptidase
MSRIKLLRDIVDDMHALANSLSTLASALESDKPAKTELSLSDVRAVLAKKSQAGFTREIKVLIEKYGAEKLSAVEPKHYEALLKEVEGLKK